jgi:hypothetical protein
LPTPLAPEGSPTFALHVEVDASDGTPASSVGLVRATPPDPRCVASCDTRLPAGAVVTLEAQAFQSFTFKGWSEPERCAEVPNVHERCTLTMPAADLALRAHFARTGGTIRVSSGGDSSITSEPDGLRCGNDGTVPQLCDADFAIGTRVTLRLALGTGSRVIGWGLWQCPHARTTCTFTVDGDLDVNARVSPVTLQLRRFDLSATGGTIASDPPGLICGAGCTSAQARFPYGTTVRLFPTTQAAQFGGWNAPCKVSTPLPGCELTLSRDTFAMASFVEPPPQAQTSADERLVISVRGSGKGKVRATSDDGSEHRCSRRCTIGHLRYTQKVVLKATPTRGSHWQHWSGGICPGHRTCKVSAGITESARAVFGHGS